MSKKYKVMKVIEYFYQLQMGNPHEIGSYCNIEDKEELQMQIDKLIKQGKLIKIDEKPTYKRTLK